MPCDVFERLSRRLDAAAERAGRHSNAARIRLLYEVMFGADNGPEKPDPANPPE